MDSSPLPTEITHTFFFLDTPFDLVFCLQFLAQLPLEPWLEHSALMDFRNGRELHRRRFVLGSLHLTLLYVAESN